MGLKVRKNTITLRLHAEAEQTCLTFNADMR